MPGPSGAPPRTASQALLGRTACLSHLSSLVPVQASWARELTLPRASDPQKVVGPPCLEHPPGQPPLCTPTPMRGLLRWEEVGSEHVQKQASERTRASDSRAWGLRHFLSQQLPTGAGEGPWGGPFGEPRPGPSRRMGPLLVAVSRLERLRWLLHLGWAAGTGGETR